MPQPHRTMRRSFCIVRTASVAFAATASVSLAGTIPVAHSESVQGDLSNDQAAPTPVTLSNPTSQVSGNVGGLDVQDFLRVTIPTGFNLTGYTYTLYRSLDGRSFTGVVAGSTFAGNIYTPADYLGYAHFGNAQVGVNLLPRMGDTNLALGAQGFSGSLPAGTYTFLVQQLGPDTEYSFNFQLTPVPAPGAAALLGIGGLALSRRRR